MPKKHRHTPKLVAYLRGTALTVGDPRAAQADPRAAAVRSLADADPAVRALVDALLERGGCFALGELEISLGPLFRGRGGEPWNGAGAVIGARELPLAKSGAGDLYVWNADDCTVCLRRHDQGWQERGRWRSVDAFLDAAMWSALESVEADDLNTTDAARWARISLAVAIAGAEALDDEARMRLIELGVIADEEDD